jgi:hypothetical protein
MSFLLMLSRDFPRYLFGGYDGKECHNDLYVLFCGTLTALSRLGISLPSFFFLFCFWPPSRFSLAEISEQGVETWTWRRLQPAGEIPCRRAGHAAIAYGTKVHVLVQLRGH